jgi:hypothetical protein
MALSRMEFLPSFVLRRNKLRGSPHYSIALATGIPIVILIAVLGNINTLGDMYAFGLLGAFTLTCLGLDLVRYREWRAAKKDAAGITNLPHGERSNREQAGSNNQVKDPGVSVLGQPVLNAELSTASPTPSAKEVAEAANARLSGLRGLWFKIDFWLGVITTFLVALAWSTNLVSKPLATLFGGGVAAIGMVVAYANYVGHKRRGRVPVPVVVTRVQERMPDAVLAVLTAANGHNDAVIRAAVNTADHTERKKPLVFLYLAEPKPRTAAPRMMEIVDPYLEDQHAKEYFGKAEGQALKAKIPTRRFVYIQKEPNAASQVWQIIHPHDTVVAADKDEQFKDINPDRIRYELTPAGKVAHLVKRWS